MSLNRLSEDGQAAIAGEKPASDGTTAGSSATKQYYATIYPGKEQPLHPKFAERILGLEAALNMPVWLLVQNVKNDHFGTISAMLYQLFREQRASIAADQPVALLIESPGGDAHAAYRLARLFQRRASKLTVIVPSYAKSAATLLALGASEIIMGSDAELGPLDVQMVDFEREDYGSALDAVQALERLNAFLMVTVDQLMPMLIERTHKKLDTILPMVLKYTTDFVRPMIEKIDTLDYTKKSRELKVAEEYAVRLLKHACGLDTEEAQRIARHLVEKYPTHGFVIDRDECETDNEMSASAVVGLKIIKPDTTASDIIENLFSTTGRITAIGQVKEVDDGKAQRQ